MSPNSDRDEAAQYDRLAVSLRRSALAYCQRYAASEAHLARILERKLSRWRRSDGEDPSGDAASDARLIADHVVEIEDGGAPLDVANGMTLCVACHNRKTAQARADRTRRLPGRGGG